MDHLKSKTSPADGKNMGDPIPARTALFIGNYSSEQRDLMRISCSRAEADGVFRTTLSEAQEFLQKGSDKPPRCIFIDTNIDNLESFVSWLRGEAKLFCVPVAAFVKQATSKSLGDVHSAGADDAVIVGDFGAITRRLANLQPFDPLVRPPLTQGRAILGVKNEAKRRVLGRILRCAGFDVSFAREASEAVSISQTGEPPILAVLEYDLPPNGAPDAIKLIRSGPDTPMLPCVVLSVDGQASRPELRSVSYGHADAPPDNLLFLANELLRPQVQNLRASPRLLFGGICAFRPAGQLEAAYGLTYNISREGLYVRTLDPPQAGTQLWFEMLPPDGRGVVHLRGEGMWRRGLNSPGGAAPPGFGLRIDSEASPPLDLRGYREAYELLRAAIR